jgi:hypothetical protein
MKGSPLFRIGFCVGMGCSVGKTAPPSTVFTPINNDSRRRCSSGPLLHAIYPGVFDQTRGCRVPNEGQFGLCLGILGKRGPNMSWIGKVSNKKKNRILRGNTGGLLSIGNGIFHALNLNEKR